MLSQSSSNQNYIAGIRGPGMINRGCYITVVYSILLYLLLSSGFLRAGNLLEYLDFDGYFENRFYLLNYLDKSWEESKEKFKLGDYNRLRLQLKASPSTKVTVFAAMDMFTFHGFITGPLGAVDKGAITDSSVSTATNRIDLDRAYVDLYLKKCDISIGKQRVAMGVSYLWAPLDLFNRINLLEPKEEKPGTTAIKVYVPLGAASGVTAVFAPADNFSYSTSGFRIQTQALGVDMAATVITGGIGETTVYGLDLRGETGIGWWLEGGYFHSHRQRNLKIVLGFDYTFPIHNGLYWLNEFFYDQSGEKNSTNYDFQLLANGTRFTLGQKYYFSLLRYSFSDFWISSLSYMGNWDDGSFLLNPTLQYEVSQNIAVSMGLYLPLGKNGGELHRVKMNMFFIWLKVNF